MINEPEEFRVRRRFRRGRRRVTAWVPLRKSVAYLFRYREISLQSNSRYLNALAEVDDPSIPLQALDKITTRKQSSATRPVKAFNPLARSETQLFAAVMRASTRCTASPIGIYATHSSSWASAWRTIPRSAAPKSVVCSIVSTYTRSSPRFRALAAGASRAWATG